MSGSLLKACALTMATGLSATTLASAPPASAKPAPQAPTEGKRSAPAKRLDYHEARRFVVSLINRDRKKAGLPPVVLDEAGSKAGDRHARDMAANGFTGHVGSDGSVPEQRYTEAGGEHYVQENAACLFDTEPRKLAESPSFDATKLAALHEMFMAEVPPNDGHRRNVLAPLHNRVGIGLAQPASVDQPCLAQEFIDQYGEYAPVPRQVSAKTDTRVRIAGAVSAPLVFGGVGVGRTPLPERVPRERLNRGGYRIPAPETMYFPAGFKTPKPVKVEGGRFSIEVDLGTKGRPGRYAVTVWAKRPDSPKLFMISMRTVVVR